MTMITFVAWLHASTDLFALETDQFTTPPKPLADIGVQVSQQIHDTLAVIIQHVNEELDQLTAQRNAATDDAARAGVQAKIDERLNGRLIAEQLYKAVGVGIPETSLERWIRTHDFKRAEPVLFEVECANSVTGICLQRPLIMIGLAPTINMFGSYFGTDKIGHFFQQGYENYELDLKARAANVSEAGRREQVVAKGRELETGVFGLFLSGIYSNADLASDYAGYKFYLNLTEPIHIGAATQPPMLVVKDQRWIFNPRFTDPLMKPFVSDHFNEAFNPCEYEESFQTTVQAAVALRAPSALAFYHTTAERELGHLEQLATWYGENYGHRGFAKLITLPSVMGLKITPGVVTVQERLDTAVP